MWGLPTVVHYKVSDALRDTELQQPPHLFSMHKYSASTHRYGYFLLSYVTASEYATARLLLVLT